MIESHVRDLVGLAAQTESRGSSPILRLLFDRYCRRGLVHKDVVQVLRLWQRLDSVACRKL